LKELGWGWQSVEKSVIKRSPKKAIESVKRGVGLFKKGGIGEGVCQGRGQWGEILFVVGKLIMRSGGTGHGVKKFRLRGQS